MGRGERNSCVLVLGWARTAVAAARKKVAMVNLMLTMVLMAKLFVLNVEGEVLLVDVL